MHVFRKKPGEISEKGSGFQGVVVEVDHFFFKQLEVGRHVFSSEG